MKKNNRCFLIINSIIFILMISYMSLHPKRIYISNISSVFILVSIFIVIHFLRIIRQYIILMESKIKIFKLIKAYLLSSLMNNILPYKIGEIYKMYLYGHIIQDNKKSVISVITDKFFDAAILLIIFIIVEIKSDYALSYITIFLLILVISIVAIYISFEKTYKLLNNYLIINKNTKFSVKCLKILEDINEMYKTFKNMIKDREILIILLTILSWFFEIVFVYIIYTTMNSEFIVSNFIKYVNNSFLGLPNELSGYYTFYTFLISFVLVNIIYLQKVFNSKNRSRYEKNNNNL